MTIDPGAEYFERPNLHLNMDLLAQAADDLVPYRAEPQSHMQSTQDKEEKNRIRESFSKTQQNMQKTSGLPKIREAESSLQHQMTLTPKERRGSMR